MPKNNIITLQERVTKARQDVAQQAPHWSDELKEHLKMLKSRFNAVGGEWRPGCRDTLVRDLSQLDPERLHGLQKITEQIRVELDREGTPYILEYTIFGDPVLSYLHRTCTLIW